MRPFALNVKAQDKPLYRRMLPLLPFYGIRLQYPLSDPGCADGEKLRDGVVEMIASNPEAGNEIGGAGGARKVRIAGRGKGKSDTPTPGPGRMQIRPVTSVFWSASLGCTPIEQEVAATNAAV